MSHRLNQVLTFTDVAAHTIVSLPHDINVYGVHLVPDFIFRDNGSFTVVSCTSTELTVENTSDFTATLNAWLLRQHTFDREYGSNQVTSLSPQPYIPAVGGAGSGGSTIIVEDETTVIPGNPFNTLNFSGPGVEATDGGSGVADIEIIDAVIFDDATPANRVNIRSDRASNQSPINNTAVGITNLGSNSGGIATGATADYATISGGDDNTASGQLSTVLGGSTNTASNYGTVAGGYRAVASGSNAVAIGNSVTASGGGATAFGSQNTASGDTSFIANSQNTASGDDSVAFGNSTTASGDGSFAEGIGTLSSAYGSHAEGSGTRATHEAAHAEGYETLAGADRAHAQNDRTEATGLGSHAAGFKSKASGDFSSAHGIYAKATRESQLAVASGRVSQDGDAQTSIIVMRAKAADPREPGYSVALKYGDAGTAFISLDNKRAYGVRVHAICGGDPGGVTSAYIIKDLTVVCVGGTATIIAAGTQTITGAALAVAEWTLDASVSGADLVISFSPGGDVATQDIWVSARVEFVECQIANVSP